MRRLAKQSRNDAYSSSRDYQTAFARRALRFTVNGADVENLVFVCPDAGTNASHLAAVGGFFRGPNTLTIEITLRVGEQKLSRKYQIGTNWRRVGFAHETREDADIEISIKMPRGTLEVFGLNAGFVVLPDGIGPISSIYELNQSHLAPETFYLDHDGDLLLDLDKAHSGGVQVEAGSTIKVKKCSYCGRFLPLELERPGTLSFHKHLAKRTDHQNECRACKKWRINDDFNPTRTTDQLHESSLITREKRLFLRDPKILQQFKDRHGGEGLKSFIWKRFGKRCFYCGKPLKLKDVQLDHTRPLAYLHPIDEHATCLCAAHNNEKGDKFPVDFYSDAQLRELATITGLAYDELLKRTVDETELARVRRRLVQFSRAWDARTFASVARRVREIDSGVDLFEELRQLDEEAYAELCERLAERPLPVGEEAES